MDIIRSPAPISLDGIHRQLHTIGLKINKATTTKSGFFSSNNKNNNDNQYNSDNSNATTPSYYAGSAASHDINNLSSAGASHIDVNAIQSALSECDSLLNQIRSACEEYSDSEPTVLQLESSVWILKAKIEHISGRFRQSSSCYENACKLLLKVEAARAPIFTTGDALNHAVSCLLYACGELVLAEHIVPSNASSSSISKFVSSSILSTTSSSSSSSVSQCFLYGNQQEQQQAFSMFTTLGDAFSNQNENSNNSATGGDGKKDGANNKDSSSNNSSNNTNNKQSIGSRLSTWFKGLPSIQPANSPAAAVAAEEQEALRKQREAEKLAKARREACWRLLPLDAPHRFPASQRISSLLRFMARELLKYDSIDLASHFADLSARYCLDYKFQFSFNSNLYQASAMKRKLEIVAPAAPSPPSPIPRGFVPIPVSLCQLFGGEQETSSSSSVSLSSFPSPVVEFCSVSNIHPAVRQQFIESMLQVCSTSLALRQYERARISATFALFCLENKREELFSYSVPNDHVNLALYNMMSNSNLNFMQNESFSVSASPLSSAAGAVPSDSSSPTATTSTPPSVTSHFVTVATMNSNFSDEIKCDENCAMIGLSIVLAVLSSRPFPDFERIVKSHIEWWSRTFVEPFLVEDQDEEEEVPEDSEFFAWRRPVRDSLLQFVDAVLEKRKSSNDGSNNDVKLFATSNALKMELLERNQLFGLCAHRLFHEVYSAKKDQELVGSLVKLEEKQEKQSQQKQQQKEHVEGDEKDSEKTTEKRASSPKLDDLVSSVNQAKK